VSAALWDEEKRRRLATFLAAGFAARACDIAEPRLLPNGAVQENWLLDAVFAGGGLPGRRRLVLRTHAQTSLGLGLDRAGEFAVMRAARAAGILVPEPLLLSTDAAVIGKPFLVMRWIAGETAGGDIVARAASEGLAATLAGELAKLHRIAPPRSDLACLGVPPADAARARIAELARLLAADADPHPVAEWGLRWLRLHAPPPAAPVLCHGDFRTGNYLVAEGRLAGILDWEFAGWSDPDEDLAWFCLGPWRFGAYAREAGGVASRRFFCDAYAAVAGRSVDPDRLRFWEVMAALRWLVLALRQRDRCLAGGERSLDLALTGRRAAECEFEILRLTEAA
jgi:aminoglycoside phosphotransferase (APT) family kinase protein